MKKLGEVVKISLILFLITAIAALLLAYVNKVTAPLIAENNQKKINDALAVVMTSATDFEKVENTDIAQKLADNYDAEVDSIYMAKNADKTVGVCAIVVTKGYDAGLTTAVGVNLEGKVEGIEIISHKETPGLGANATKPEFKDKFKGKTQNIAVVKSGAKDNEIDAMSGATMTSNGVTDGVNCVIDIAAELMKEGM